MTTRIPIIIDTDMALGSAHADIDDAIAVLVALAEPMFEILAITGSGGNVPIEHACLNIDRLLHTLGKASIPHCFSNTRPLDSALWVDSRWKQQEHDELPPVDHSVTSSDVIRKLLRESRTQVTVVVIGPLTNIALALTIEPDLVEKIDKIVMMGGSMKTPGVGGGATEFNIRADVESAALIFSFPVDIHMFGLDVTKRRKVRPNDIARWDDPSSPFLKYLFDSAVAFMHFRARRDGYDEPYAFFHDVLPVVYLTHPQWFEMTPCMISVDVCGHFSRGVTLIDTKISGMDSPRHFFATDVDADTIFDFVVNVVDRNYRRVPI